MSMQILTREECLPCEGKGTIAATHQALRIPCAQCDGLGYRERWVDARTVLRDLTETLKTQREADAPKVLAETAQKPMRHRRDK